VYLDDNVEAWLLQADGSYKRATVTDGVPVCAQTRLLERYTTPSGREHAQP
jgi:polyphosphate kinase